MRRDFDEALDLGNRGERLVLEWLQSRDAGVIPSYDFCGKDGAKAPRLQFKDKQFAIPDLDVCRNGSRSWLEVKTYHGPAKNHRHDDVAVHGIPWRLYNDYCSVAGQTGTPVWITVLELDSGVLLGARLDKLEMWPCTCAYCEKRGPGPCRAPIREGVYWRRSSMREWNRFGEAEIASVRSARSAA